MNIKEVTQKNIEFLMSYLLSIDEMNFAKQSWDAQCFRVVLPHKWDLSFVVVDNEEIIGFCIASLKSDDCVHLHRIALHPSYQNKGIGTFILDRLWLKTKQLNACTISLKVPLEKKSAICFYLNKGFKTLFKTSDHYFMLLFKESVS